MGLTASGDILKNGFITNTRRRRQLGLKRGYYAHQAPQATTNQAPQAIRVKEGLLRTKRFGWVLGVGGSFQVLFQKK
jgi:hypothetical protein